MHFNQSKFINEYTKVESQLDDIEILANLLKEQSFSNIFLVGSGGAYTKFVDLRPLFFEKLDIPFTIVSPEELSVIYLDKINEETLIIVGSKTGETKELISSLEKIKNYCKKVVILGFIGDSDTELDRIGVLNHRISSVDTDVNLILLGWFILVYSESENLKEIKNQLQGAGEKIALALANNEEKAFQIVDSAKINQMQMWVTSGALWGEACCFSNYMLEEIQRVEAQAIHSSEFFHGPFELVDKGFQINVILNSEKTRAYDNRVLDFVQKHTNLYSVIDMNDFKLGDLNVDLKKFIEPYVLNHYFDMLLQFYTERTGKSSGTRRYYRITEY